MSLILDLLREMVPLSLVSFGGGKAIIAQLETIAVRQHHWITAQEFLHFFAITRVAPGPGTTLAALIGWQLAGSGARSRPRWRSMRPRRCCATRCFAGRPGIAAAAGIASCNAGWRRSGSGWSAPG